MINPIFFYLHVILIYLSEMDLSIYCTLNSGKQDTECEFHFLKNSYVDQDEPD